MSCVVVLNRAYLSSSDVSEILSGQRQALAGIDVLRKICNHPDLLQRTQAQGSVTYGEPSRYTLHGMRHEYVKGLGLGFKAKP